MHIARSSTRFAAALLALLLGLGVLAGPAAPVSAQAEPDPAAPSADTRIIGGETAPPGAWPSQAAIFITYREGSWSETYLGCGGTVIDPTWVLTAAHCVFDGPNRPLSPRDVKVKVGTQDLASGGRFIQASRIVVRPDFNFRTRINDVALIQLAQPTDVARDLEVASPTDIPWGNAPLTTAGWGETDVPTDWPAQKLRQVEVPAMTGQECKDTLTDLQAEFGTPPYHSSYLCTGPLGSGGRGPCYGDDGGPLVWEQGGRKILVGIVSVSDFCASPEAPSVYAKVASASNWIRQTIQYGPHWNAQDFAWAVSEAYFDFVVVDDDWIELPEPAPAGEPGAYIAAFHQKPVVTKRDATIVRLYDAILGRPAENFGYQYWRQQMLFARYSATRVAEVMARSPEFKAEYGSLSNEDFVEQLFLNILGRAGSSDDVTYWTGRLSGGESRGRVALLIAESGENKANTQDEVDVQVAFMNLLYRAPAAWEMDQWVGEPLEDLGRFLVHSVAYARRWGYSYYEEGEYFAAARAQTAG